MKLGVTANKTWKGKKDSNSLITMITKEFLNLH